MAIHPFPVTMLSGTFYGVMYFGNNTQWKSKFTQNHIKISLVGSTFDNDDHHQFHQYNLTMMKFSFFHVFCCVVGYKYKPSRLCVSELVMKLYWFTELRVSLWHTGPRCSSFIFLTPFTHFTWCTQCIISSSSFWWALHTLHNTNTLKIYSR